MKDKLINAEHELDETYWWFVGRRAIVTQILSKFVKQAAVAVDVGCGSGRNMLILRNHAGLTIGLDRSSAALALASALGFPVARADGQVLPLAAGSADLLTALDVLEHLDNDMTALAEFHRVLRPNGFLLLTVPAYRFLWSEHDEALLHRRRYVASELHIKLARSGFRAVKRSYAVFFPFFPIVLYRLFRGLVPKNPLEPAASHVMLPGPLNSLFVAALRLEGRLMGGISLPWGTSIIAVAQKLPPAA
ncbi:MAG TPA: class I SAM-dependent methyltransferase [Terriglobia bacterium]|nr:class I SAM-dependent methyltransferase [Terriglobia bacterium]